MPRTAHHEAAEHHEQAAKSHRTAAEHHDKGDHEAAKKHATDAHAHSTKAHGSSTTAHGKTHGADHEATRKNGKNPDHPNQGTVEHSDDGRLKANRDKGIHRGDKE